ncbi:MAG: hypothetical protein J3Q66DRAFT_404432 [Benniella sp.]|nr:MAG: hypothetical protein J3Q66DRAFT_404432 [Benniella sp.]
MIKQYSTPVAQTWSGPIYKKAIDYLTRILLRLHLAPDREQTYKALPQRSLHRLYRHSHLERSAFSNVTHNKSAVFGAFFDLEKIKSICRDNDLQFRNRIIYVERYTVRLVGDVVRGNERNGYPVLSEYVRKEKEKEKLPESPFRDFESGREIDLYDVVYIPEGNPCKLKTRAQKS